MTADLRTFVDRVIVPALLGQFLRRATGWRRQRQSGSGPAGSQMSSMRCALYARFSSDLQRETSIADQVAVARRYVAARLVRPRGSPLHRRRLSSARLEPRDSGSASPRRAGSLPFRSSCWSMIPHASPGTLPMPCGSSRELTFFGVRVLYLSQGIDSPSAKAGRSLVVPARHRGSALYLPRDGRRIQRGLGATRARIRHQVPGPRLGYHTGAPWPIRRQDSIERLPACFSGNASNSNPQNARSCRSSSGTPLVWARARSLSAYIGLTSPARGAGSGR